MGTVVLTNAYITINGSDLSDDGNQVEINYAADAVEETAFSDDTHIFKGGLKNWDMSMTFNQDFADNALDEILFALVGTQVAIAVRPDSGGITTSNPEYQGTGLIESYSPFGNGVGELAQASVKIRCAGTLVRDVTA